MIEGVANNDAVNVHNKTFNNMKYGRESWNP